MIRDLSLGSLLLATLCLASAQPAEARRSSRPARVRAMTFNIRYDFESDGQNRWQYRAEAVAKTVAASGAKVVCLQEDKAHQIEDLQRLLPEFTFVGRGRNATGSGERCSIAFDSKAFRLREHGDLWLSDTPGVPGSNTWGDRYPRKATWALLELRKGKQKLLVVNTHLPEGNSDRLRVRGGEVIHAWLSEHLAGDESSRRRGRRGGDGPAVIVAGDFNDDAGSTVHDRLTGPELGLRDVWEETPPVDRSPGTYGGFQGLQTTSRIDWLLVGGRVRVLAAAKVAEQVDDRWPSDHYPVIADLEVH